MPYLCKKFIFMENRTKEIIEKMGISKKELAEKIGMTPIGLQQLMRKKMPKVATLENIAKGMGVPTWRLLLSESEIDEIVEMRKKETNETIAVCPHCGKGLIIS